MLNTIRILCILSYLLWAIGAYPAHAQTSLAQTTTQPTTTNTAWATDSTLGDALRHLAVRAGVAFVGSVQSIQLPTADNPGTVTIKFQVMQPVLGDPGPVYTLHEWAGLWTFGRQRYTPGQRALFFFHPPSAAGLSSPVDGMEGIVPFVPTSADAAPLLDVRRLATRVLRRVGDPLPYASTGAITVDDAANVLTHTAQPLEPTPRPLPIGVLPAPPAPVRPLEQQRATISSTAGAAR